MPNLNDIKNRIKSVKNTGKITQAMKMVAASKVKKAESAAKESRPYSQFLVKIFSQLIKNYPAMEIKNYSFEKALENCPQLLQNRPVKNVGLLVITADKGLAGAYNTNIIKETLNTIKELQKQKIGIKLFIVGLKGISSLSKTFENSNVEIIKKYSKIPSFVEVEVANMIAEDIAQVFIEGKIDAIDIINTNFKSMLSYKVNKFRLLPLSMQDNQATGINSQMIFEPSAQDILQKLLPMYISNSIYIALKESIASELASRMNAMSNATKNAEEIVKMLSNIYNKARQYSITTELIDVVSGANSIKD